jgi:hypothetical protein
MTNIILSKRHIRERLANSNQIDRLIFLNWQKDCALKSNLKKDDPTRYTNLLEWLDNYISLVTYNQKLYIENDTKYKPTSNLDEFIN